MKQIAKTKPSLGAVERTDRGFELIQFKDSYGVDCTLQQSSIATEFRIWLGCDDANPRVLVPGAGWKGLKMPPDYLADTRMHLTQDQVEALIVHLQHWLKTGRLS